MLRNRLFSFAKIPNVGSAVLKGLRFADPHESRFQAWKRSYMSSAFLQGDRFADVPVLFFHTAKTVRYGLFRTASVSIC